MAGTASAFETLGLEPGADAAAIERAYKRLIKLYHPDRDGGDAKRAAEINRAYRELRRRRNALELERDVERDGRSLAGLAALAALAAASVALVLISAPDFSDFDTLAASSAPQVKVGAVPPAESPIDAPLALAAIDEAIADAVRIGRGADEMALAGASRDCHRQLRKQPAIARLDRCAAFDATVVQLQDRDPLRDRGPFSELAVTGRLMSGAALLSDDSLAIDSRLRQIRLRVALALAPPPEPMVAETD